MENWTKTTFWPSVGPPTAGRDKRQISELELKRRGRDALYSTGAGTVLVETATKTNEQRGSDFTVAR